MKMYNVYSIESLNKREITIKLFRILFACCDTFSLVYFKYNENDKTPSGTKEIKKKLSKYKFDSRLVSKWPLTETKNEQKHFYRMVTYKIDHSDMSVLSAFELPDTLWDWDYPDYPMDPCFYRDGLIFFASCTHEQMNELYLRADGDILSPADYQSIGLNLLFLRQVPEDKLFKNMLGA